eukprot:GFKZ01011088.1.p3 GENE.GFKZ01011088.1~~GFKZ01011088.1.p3  ORF type:complete len:101 (-),score=5.05 GFKZ01011088.1:243-545(-)
MTTASYHAPHTTVLIPPNLTHTPPTTPKSQTAPSKHASAQHSFASGTKNNMTSECSNARTKWATITPLPGNKHNVRHPHQAVTTSAAAPFPLAYTAQVGM